MSTITFQSSFSTRSITTTSMWLRVQGTLLLAGLMSVYSPTGISGIPQFPSRPSLHWPDEDMLWQSNLVFAFMAMERFVPRLA